MSWFKMNRGWLDNLIFKNKPYSEREAYAWLVENMAYTETSVTVDHTIVPLKPGQLAFSLRFLACKWQWKRTKVGRFLNRLKTAALISTDTDKGVTRITLADSNICDDMENRHGTESGTATEEKSGTAIISIDSEVSDDLEEQFGTATEEKSGTESGTKNKKEINNKQTSACARLENLRKEDLNIWLQQMEMQGTPITADIGLELEKFKSHFLASGGKDKNGNQVFDWHRKAHYWLLDASSKKNTTIYMAQTKSRVGQGGGMLV